MLRAFWVSFFYASGNFKCNKIIFAFAGTGIVYLDNNKSVTALADVDEQERKKISGAKERKEIGKAKKRNVFIVRKVTWIFLRLRPEALC